MADKDFTVRLIIDGAPAGDSKLYTPPGFLGTTTLGGASDKWGLDPSRAQVESANFGVQLVFDGFSGSWNAGIDSVEIIVYTEPDLLGAPSKSVKVRPLETFAAPENEFTVKVKKKDQNEVEQ